MDLLEKLSILSAAAKYDVSCSSSGSYRENQKGGLGNAAPSGICHSWSDDGRCISLLKILLTNFCIHDCSYCINRRSNDVKRAGFTVNEVVKLTMDFYSRNYIEGLFLSSGVFQNPDLTMEKLIRVVKKLRIEERFNGYIHLKAIPGASDALIEEAGLYVDRLSVNIELPSENSLRLLAPDKSQNDITQAMDFITDKIAENREEKKKYRYVKRLFVPAGQTTQLIVGASPESDYDIMRLASELYDNRKLKRVYYSAYVPINQDSKLPALVKPPLLRENRLYQTDWLLRFYHFTIDEILGRDNPNLDEEFDPKTGWALRHLDFFPVDVDTADYETLLRVPGIGIRSAQRIIATRRFGGLDFESLKKIGVVMKRAVYFIVCKGRYLTQFTLHPDTIKAQITQKQKLLIGNRDEQLLLF